MGNKKDIRENFEVKLRCPNCGNYTSIQRSISQGRERDHIKNLHCPHCKTYQKFTEIRNYDKVRYLELNNDPTTIKIYNNINRIMIKLEVNNQYFKVMNELESRLVNNSIILNSDYNLMETLILNYINNDTEFRTKVKEIDRMDIYDPVILGLNIKKPLYDLFEDYCKVNDIDKMDTLQRIVKLVSNEELSFKFSTRKVNN